MYINNRKYAAQCATYLVLREGYKNNTQYVSRPGSKIENFNWFSNIQASLQAGVINGLKEAGYIDKTSTCRATKGNYCNNGTVTPCPTGSQCGYDNLIRPIPCNANTYNDITGQTSCKNCPDGKITNNLTGQTSINACIIPCRTGTYTTDNNITCKNCPKGTYNDIPGSFSCKDCPNGRYNDNEGSASCNTCSSLNQEYRENNASYKISNNCHKYRFTNSGSGSQYMEFRDNLTRREYIPKP